MGAAAPIQATGVPLTPGSVGLCRVEAQQEETTRGTQRRTTLSPLVGDNHLGLPSVAQDFRRKTSSKAAHESSTCCLPESPVPFARTTPTRTKSENCQQRSSTEKRIRSEHQAQQVWWNSCLPSEHKAPASHAEANEPGDEGTPCGAAHCPAGCETAASGQRDTSTSIASVCTKGTHHACDNAGSEHQHTEHRRQQPCFVLVPIVVVIQIISGA
mmetsp:Transcript_169628/g.538568  ORF Transcript_169628/g.538568 Transcript_169628/m.538568 type:complete len:214 (+) Transcript_169628:742-1383(+)